MHRFHVNFKFVQINVCMLTVCWYSVSTHYTCTHFTQYIQQSYEVILGLQIEETVIGRVRDCPKSFKHPIARPSALNCIHHSISGNEQCNNCSLPSLYVPVYGSLIVAAFLIIFLKLCWLIIFLKDVFLSKVSGVKRNVTLMRVFYVFIYMRHISYILTNMLQYNYYVLLLEIKHLSTYISDSLYKYLLFIKTYINRWVWWLIPIIPALGKLR